MTSSDKDKFIIAERGRTLDQIKRLYAVVMGFAATECIKSIITCVRFSDNPRAAAWVFVSLGICFISLMVLFFLAAERYLDRVYLDKVDGDATWNGLGYDILTLITTSTWFVILSKSLPSEGLGPNSKTLHINSFKLYDSDFVRNLLWLYAIDSILLAIQYARLRKTKMNIDNIDQLIWAHIVWMATNIVSIVFLKYAQTLNMFQSGPVALAILLLAAHLLRVVVDFQETFPLYFPVRKEKHRSGWIYRLMNLR